MTVKSGVMGVSSGILAALTFVAGCVGRNEQLEADAKSILQAAEQSLSLPIMNSEK